jgi:hypothetical protein
MMCGFVILRVPIEGDRRLIGWRLSPPQDTPNDTVFGAVKRVHYHRANDDALQREFFQHRDYLFRAQWQAREHQHICGQVLDHPC